MWKMPLKAIVFVCGKCYKKLSYSSIMEAIEARRARNATKKLLYSTIMEASERSETSGTSNRVKIENKKKTYPKVKYISIHMQNKTITY